MMQTQRRRSADSISNRIRDMLQAQEYAVDFDEIPRLLALLQGSPMSGTQTGPLVEDGVAVLVQLQGHVTLLQILSRYKDSSAASRVQMDSGGVGVGATLHCLLLAWDKGGGKETEHALVERWSRPIWEVLEVLIDQCITSTRLSLGLGPSLLVNDGVWGSQQERGEEGEEGGGRRAGGATTTREKRPAAESKYGPLQAALMGLRLLLALNARYVGREGRESAAACTLGEEGLWEGVGRDNVLSRLVRARNTSTSSTQEVYSRLLALVTMTMLSDNSPSQRDKNRDVSTLRLAASSLQAFPIVHTALEQNCLHVHPEVSELYVLCGGISRLSSALHCLLPKPQALQLPLQRQLSASQRPRSPTSVAFAGPTDRPSLYAAASSLVGVSHANAEAACDLLGGLSKLLPLDISEDMCMYVEVQESVSGLVDETELKSVQAILPYATLLLHLPFTQGGWPVHAVRVCAWGMACLCDVGVRSRGRFEEELLHADVIALAPRLIATIQDRWVENVSGDVGRCERQGRLLWILRAATALQDFMADDEDVGMQVQAQLLPSNARVSSCVMEAIAKNIRLPTFPKPEHEGHRKAILCSSLSLLASLLRAHREHTYGQQQAQCHPPNKGQGQGQGQTHKAAESLRVHTPGPNESLLKSALVSCAPVLKCLWGGDSSSAPAPTTQPTSATSPRATAALSLPAFITSQHIGVDEAETFVALADLLVGLCEEYSVAREEDEDLFQTRSVRGPLSDTHTHTHTDTQREASEWFMGPSFYADPEVLLPVLKRQQERVEKITSSPGLLHIHRLGEVKAIISRLSRLSHYHEAMAQWSISPYASPRPRYTLAPLPAFRKKQDKTAKRVKYEDDGPSYSSSSSAATELPKLTPSPPVRRSVIMQPQPQVSPLSLPSPLPSASTGPRASFAPTPRLTASQDRSRARQIPTGSAVIPQGRRRRSSAFKQEGRAVILTGPGSSVILPPDAAGPIASSSISIRPSPHEAE